MTAGLLTAVAVLAMANVACDDDAQIIRLEPRLWTYDPAVPEPMRPEAGLTRIDFGEVPLGATVLRPLGIANLGRSLLTVCLEGATGCVEVTRIEPVDDQFEVRFENPDGETGLWTVVDGQDREVGVRFTPTAPGRHVTELVLVHNGDAGTTRIALTGVGVAPSVDFSVTELDFGAVTVDARKALEVTLTNETNFVIPVQAAPFEQDAVVFGTNDPSGFEVPYDEALAFDLPAAGAVTFQVWYQPPAEETHSHTLTVQYCPDCTQTIAVRGRGIKPVFQLRPAALDFGDVAEGDTETRSFDIVNVGTVDLEVRSVDVERGTSSEYRPRTSAALPFSLAPQQTQTVTVDYVAETPGRDTGRIEVVTDAWDDTENMTSASVAYVAVDGTAIGPDINPFPPEVIFGAVSVGDRRNRILALQNSGNAPLTITEVTLSASAEIRLGRTPAVPATVMPGASLDVDLVYSPIDAGPDEATVTVRSDDGDEGTVTVPVAGVGGVPTTCSINVAPSRITFGLIERGREAFLPVEIRNGGAEPCSVSNIALRGDDEFALTDGVQPMITVRPGSLHRLTVAYRPTAYGDHSTELSFDADDPGRSTVRVPISGSSAVSSILVVPSTVDFSVVPVTCWSPRRQITIYNTGVAVVAINNVYLDPSTTTEFDLVPVNTPVSLAGGDATTIDIYYQPRDIGSDTGLLFIAHSASSVPVAVPLFGEGQVSATVTDTFQQLPTPKADVLFVVDDSGSMADEQRNLGTNLTSFLSFAQQEGIDYQIAVTTTDVGVYGEQGRFVPLMGATSSRIITPQTPNAAAVFQSNTNVGTGGSGTERGLEAAYLALSDPLINTHNAGFLRSDAALALIFVSDEPDFSTRSVNFYENFFRNIKGFQNPSMMSASAVVATTSPGCNSASGDATYAPRYIRVANTTGGIVESICAANWGQTLGNIGASSFGLRRQFVLSSQPVPQTIAVSVNGTRVPSIDTSNRTNWTYDAGRNDISFTVAATPSAGATISVTYTVACLSGP